MAAETRAICDLGIKNEPQKIFLEQLKWKVDGGETNLRQAKDPSEMHETSSLFYYRNDYYKAQRRRICESQFCRSSRLHFCHFNCVVALMPRFHADVVRVYRRDAAEKYPELKEGDRRERDSSRFPHSFSR